jgi:hypothetical protein
LGFAGDTEIIFTVDAVFANVDTFSQEHKSSYLFQNQEQIDPKIERVSTPIFHSRAFNGTS